MPGLDRSRFIRILKLTNSANDSEALTAVRRANALLQAAGLSWDGLVILPPPPDPEPQATQDGRDPFWADASMFFPAPSDPMMPLGRRTAAEQAHARLRRAALRLRVALHPAWTAAVAFATGCIDKSRLHKVVSHSRRFVRALGTRDHQADGTGDIGRKRWPRFKRKV
jgi:hypothetical protein